MKQAKTYFVIEHGNPVLDNGNTPKRWTTGPENLLITRKTKLRNGLTQIGASIHTVQIWLETHEKKFKKVLKKKYAL
jgi:hypothetical protein